MKIEIGNTYKDNFGSSWKVKCEVERSCDKYLVEYVNECGVVLERICCNRGRFSFEQGRYLLDPNEEVKIDTMNFKSKNAPKPLIEIKPNYDGEARLVCEVKGIHTFGFSVNRFDKELTGWMLGILQENLSILTENAYKAGRESVIHNLKEVLS